MTSNPERIARAGIPRTSILLLVGALVLIGHEAWFGGGDDSKTAAQAAGSAPAPAAQAPVRPRVPVTPSREVQPLRGWLPAPVDSKPSPPAPPTITGEIRLMRIVFDPTDREATFAVISGWAFREGEGIGDLGVKSVLKDRVLLEDGRELTERETAWER